MSLARGLQGLARTVMSAKQSMPQRSGAGGVVKPSSMPDKPLPLWYDMWWDNGMFPGQPVVDHMFGTLPANLTMAWYAKVWAVVATCGIIGPAYYSWSTSDEFRMPYVPQQYPDEVREVLVRGRSSPLMFDYSHPDYVTNPGRMRTTWSSV